MLDTYLYLCIESPEQCWNIATIDDIRNFISISIYSLDPTQVFDIQNFIDEAETNQY